LILQVKIIFNKVLGVVCSNTGQRLLIGLAAAGSTRRAALLQFELASVTQKIIRGNAMKVHVPIVLTFGLLLGCSSDPASALKTDADYQRDVTQGMHDGLLSDITALHQAAVDLQAAAPLPTGRGWDETQDQAAIVAMQGAWIKARSGYERTEGALAPLFGDLDAAIDARYDDFLEEIGAAGDQDLFDDQGVTGMHAIERILYLKNTPASVVDAEAALEGYKAAAWPSTAAEAADFKNKLCARFVTDTQTLIDDWTPAAIDLGGAFDGLVSLMNEQHEKVSKAAEGVEESRYSQRTMADIRDNLAGTQKAYALYTPWLATKPDGTSISASVEASFAQLNTAYTAVNGVSIPQPPAGWNSDNPSASDLASPFGKLFSAVQSAVDPATPGSAVDGMNRTAKALGFMEFVPQ
jgi:iron uptake system component EfeO